MDSDVARKSCGQGTTPLIYFIEENPTYLDMIHPFFEAMDRGEFSVVTSIVTLLEVLVHPFRRGDTSLAQQYRDVLLDAENLTTIFLSQDIAEEAEYDFDDFVQDEGERFGLMDVAVMVSAQGLEDLCGVSHDVDDMSAEEDEEGDEYADGP